MNQSFKLQVSSSLFFCFISLILCKLTKKIGRYFFFPTLVIGAVICQTTKKNDTSKEFLNRYHRFMDSMMEVNWFHGGDGSHSFHVLL